MQSGPHRWANVHTTADRRRPYGHSGQRTAEPVGLTTNQKCALILVGIAAGLLIILAFAGTPW